MISHLAHARATVEEEDASAALATDDVRELGAVLHERLDQHLLLLGKHQPARHIPSDLVESHPHHKSKHCAMIRGALVEGLVVKLHIIKLGHAELAPLLGAELEPENRRPCLIISKALG